MDAAVVGLVGAIGAAALGAVGGWGAARIAVKGATYQADKQASSTCELWLRQVRRDVYHAFLHPARALADEMGEFALRGCTDSSVTDEERREARERFMNGIQHLERKSLDMAVEGASDVTAVAQSVVADMKALSRVLTSTMARGGNGFPEATRLYQRLDALTEKAGHIQGDASLR
jgi:hypothetical protein